MCVREKAHTVCMPRDRLVPFDASGGLWRDALRLSSRHFDERGGRREGGLLPPPVLPVPVGTPPPVPPDEGVEEGGVPLKVALAEVRRLEEQVAELTVLARESVRYAHRMEAAYAMAISVRRRPRP